MTEKEKIRILIADDHTLFREGIKSMFDGTEEVEFISEASNGEELVNKYISSRPDIVLADISMPGLSGICAIKRLFQYRYNPKVLFLSMDNNDEKKYMCHSSGASGLIGKDASREELLKAINRVHNGEEYFGPGWNQDKLASLRMRYKGKTSENKYEYTEGSLTHMERQIMVLIGEGYPSAQIAEKLHLGKRTVDSYRSNILRKLGLHSLAELVIFAAKNYKEIKKS